MDDNGGVVGLKWWKDFDAVDLIEELSNEIKAHSNLRKVRVESNSMGKVFYDMLKRKLAPGLVQTFTTTNESKREIIESLIEAFQTESIAIPKEPELIRELQHFTMTKTPTGKITYCASENYHDDFVMALAIAYSISPVRKTNKNNFRIALI
jgi:phage FluMu gp28-like protein